jgi:hypothetical protein
MLNHLRFTFLLCLLALLACGCGSKVATVSGTITLDGQPLTTGNVSFLPAQSGPVATGTIRSNGGYTIETGTAKGLPPGDYIVMVVATKPVTPIPGAPEQAPELITPAKYGTRETSDLRCTVKAGSNRVNFDLKSN